MQVWQRHTVTAVKTVSPPEQGQVHSCTALPARVAAVLLACAAALRLQHDSRGWKNEYAAALWICYECDLEDERRDAGVWSPWDLGGTFNEMKMSDVTCQSN